MPCAIWGCTKHMGDFERLEAKVDWLVSAVRHILEQEIGDTSVDYDEEFAQVIDEDVTQGARVPRPKGPPPCPHNQQVLVGHNVTCARCGLILTSSGVVGRDPGAPIAGQGTREESSRNPGRPVIAS